MNTFTTREENEQVVIVKISVLFEKDSGKAPSIANGKTRGRRVDRDPTKASRPRMRRRSPLPTR